MNNKIDKFFKKGVESIMIQPSENANAKFEALLNQRNKKPLLVWWHIAASLALILGTIFILNKLDNGENTNNAMAETDSKLQKIEKNESFAAIAKLDTVGTETLIAKASEEAKENIKVDATNTELVASTTQEINNKEGEKPKVDKLINKQPMIAAIPTVAATIELNETKEQELNKIETIVVASIDENTTVKKKIVPITITYTPTPSAALVANNDNLEEVDDEKKEEKPTFKSLLMAASNVSLMAEIRGAKDDLINSTFSNKNKRVNN